MIVTRFARARTVVKDQDLAQISTFCPHLERLALNLCGRLDDDVIDAWSKGFKELRHLSLYGASARSLSRPRADPVLARSGN